MEPVTFDGLFGWFGAGHTRRGVIFCGTLGYEQHCAHRWWRDLSLTVEARGCSVLRIDYPGEGDSRDATVTVGTCLDAIRRAVHVMRDDPAIEEIVLVGLRLGGTFAALIAQECTIHRLVLLAPFSRGQAYLREMRIQSKLIDPSPSSSDIEPPSAVLSVGGFVLSQELIEDLQQLDLISLPLPPAPRILVLGPDPGGLGRRYADLGCDTQTGKLPYFAELFASIGFAQVQPETKSRIVDFVTENAEPRSVPPHRPLQFQRGIAGTGWCETALQFGQGIFGIYCQADSKQARQPTVLFVNMGANVHSGYGRQTTTMARQLAQHGINSLRFDLRGIGDSSDRPDGELPIYKLDAVQDVQAAIDALNDAGVASFVAVGTCNGAYISFQTICRDERIVGAILVNLHCFDWELTHGASYGAKPVQTARFYVKLLTSAAAWKRVFSRSSHIGNIARTLTLRALSRVRDSLTGRFRATQPQPIPTRILKLRERGARVSLLYNAGDAGLVDLCAQLGSVDQAGEILGRTVQIVAGANHPFAGSVADDVLRNEILDMVAICGTHRQMYNVTC